MQKWNIEEFEDNNRKLKNYLNNVENAIVALCVNDMSAQMYLCTMLQNEYQFKVIDLKESDASFLRILDSSIKNSEKKLLFFDLILEKTEYDLIKTMNLSRDIMRKVGIVVLLVPTFIMEKIQMDMPNLNDYITLKLDYNKEYKCPLSPIYSEDNRNFIPNNVRKDKRIHSTRKVNNPAQIMSLEQYYDYLEWKQYTGVKESDVDYMIKWLFEDMREALDAAQLFQEKLNTYTDVMIDAYYKTAILLQTQQQYEKALTLFEEIMYRRKNSSRFDNSDLEALQGECYCFYKMGNYKKALSLLNEFLYKLDGVDNIPWKCKVYNDLGVCYYYLNQYSEAHELWRKCQIELENIGEYNVKRRLRIMYNEKICLESMKKNTDQYDERWKQLGKDILCEEETDSLLYCQYMLMDSWLHFRRGDLVRASKNIEKTKRIGEKIFSENEKILKNIYCVERMIQLQLGKG